MAKAASPKPKIKPTFFATPADLRAWLEKHHATETELWVGLYKKGSGKPSVTWPEVVDEALCLGWIDGIRKSLDAESYVNRITPRKPRSNWSAINVKRVAELKREGRMRPAGLRAFEQRAPEKTGIYAYENRHLAKLETAQERVFKANKKAWEYFQSRPPSYRKTAIWWVVSAKREETRAQRLETLIARCAAGLPIGVLTRPGER